jgi:hypothetical protein
MSETQEAPAAIGGEIVGPVASEQPPPRLALTERPFGVTPVGLRAERERAPLVHAFERAVMEEKLRRVAAKGRGEEEGRSFAAECGVYQGFSLAACLEIANRQDLPLTIIGLDTFTGLPPLSATDEALAPPAAIYRTRTIFDKTSLASVTDRLAAVGGASRFELVQGLFAETLPKLPERSYFFVNIDCDLYEPHMECLAYFYPRLRPGGILFFDDYDSVDYPMGQHAVDAFLADKPEMLWHVRLGQAGTNLTKSFIVKE